MCRTVGWLLLLGLCAWGSGCALWGGNPSQTIKVRLPPSPESAEISPEAWKKLRRAERLIDHEHLQKAERELNEVLCMAPQCGEAHNNLGLVYFRERRLYEAAHAFDRAIELLPGLAEPHYNLGMVLEEADRLDEAILHYEQAYALAPENPIFLGNLLRARIARGDRTDDVAALLGELVYLDSRPEWVEWARDELNIMFPIARREAELAKKPGPETSPAKIPPAPQPAAPTPVPPAPKIDSLPTLPTPAPAPRGASRDETVRFLRREFPNGVPSSEPPVPARVGNLMDIPGWDEEDAWSRPVPTPALPGTSRLGSSDQILPPPSTQSTPPAD